MALQTKPVTVIPHSCEKWKGTESIPRIEELLGIGMKIERIAERFNVTRHTITKTLKKKKPEADTTGSGSEAEASVRSNGSIDDPASVSGAKPKQEEV